MLHPFFSPEHNSTLLPRNARPANSSSNASRIPWSPQHRLTPECIGRPLTSTPLGVYLSGQALLPLLELSCASSYSAELVFEAAQHYNPSNHLCICRHYTALSPLLGKTHHNPLAR